jgi:glycerol uptake facilitator-like aquaporin
MQSSRFPWNGKRGLDNPLKRGYGGSANVSSGAQTDMKEKQKGAPSTNHFIEWQCPDCLKHTPLNSQQSLFQPRDGPESGMYSVNHLLNSLVFSFWSFLETELKLRSFFLPVKGVTFKAQIGGNFVYVLSDLYSWSIGLMLGAYVSRASGSHLNPAITLTNCIFRKFRWGKAFPYILAQTLGAFMGAAVVYANYKSAIDMFEGVGKRTVTGPTSTAGIFTTYPAPFLTTGGQLASTNSLEFSNVRWIYFFRNPGILCVCNQGSRKQTTELFSTPHLVFSHVWNRRITWLGNWLCGILLLCLLMKINPARDLGPRVFSWMAGYGNEVWRAGNYYFLVNGPGHTAYL